MRPPANGAKSRNSSASRNPCKPWSSSHRCPPLRPRPSIANHRVENTDPNQIFWIGSPHKTVVGKIFLTLVYTVSILGILFIPFIWMRRTTYIVTRTRLIAEHGYWHKSTNEIRIRDIRNIRLVEKSVLFLTATLTFDVSGSHGAEMTFWHIKSPEHVRDLIRHLQND